MDTATDYTTPSNWQHHADAAIAVTAALIQAHKGDEPPTDQELVAYARRATKVADTLAIAAWQKSQYYERKLFHTVSAWANATPEAKPGEGRFYVQSILKHKRFALSEKFSEAEFQIDSMGVGEFLKALNNQLDGDLHEPKDAITLAVEALKNAWE
jgi:hypothetical protein